MAAQSGYDKMVRRLLAAGAQTAVAETRLQRTPLHVAALGGHVEAVRALVDVGGASLHIRDRDGKVALDLANEASTVQVLKHFAVLTKRFYDALEKGLVDPVRSAIDARPWLELRSSDWGRRPLHCAAEVKERVRE